MRVNPGTTKYEIDRLFKLPLLRQWGEMQTLAAKLK